MLLSDELMEFLPAVDPLYVLSGFLVGVLVGMTGIGGGSLMTPILILLFGVHPTTAVGTDLLFASLTKTVGGASMAPRGISIGAWSAARPRQRARDDRTRARPLQFDFHAAGQHASR